MRLRAGDDAGCPGWQRASVTIDGVPIALCVELDTREGWADILATDDAGRVVFEGDAAKTYRLRGAVEVEIAPA